MSSWNEKPPDVPFPDWIEPQGHNAFVGCTVCQEVCPENRPFLTEIVEGPTSDEQTTRLLLAGTKKEDFPKEVQAILEEWRLRYLLDILPWNLGALVTKERNARAKGACTKPAG